MSEDKSDYNPADKLIKLSGKAYLQVADRIVWFRNDYPEGTIETSIVSIDEEAGSAIFRARVTTGNGGIAEATGDETKKDFPQGWIGKAETKAVGRALGYLGYGTAAAGFEEGNRPVDAPRDVRPVPRPQERPALTGQQRYDHARKHGKDPLTNDAPLWSQIDDAIKREANPDEWKRIAPNAIHIPCRECGHASTCRTEGYCQVAAAFQSKERPAPAPPAAPVANGSRPDPDQVIAILGEMDDAREPWHEIKRYADEQSTGRGGDDQLRIHDKLQAIAKRRRESVKPPASIAG
jgi:hypothetical protein